MKKLLLLSLVLVGLTATSQMLAWRDCGTSCHSERPKCHKPCAKKAVYCPTETIVHPCPTVCCEKTVPVPSVARKNRVVEEFCTVSCPPGSFEVSRNEGEAYTE